MKTQYNINGWCKHHDQYYSTEISNWELEYSPFHSPFNTPLHLTNFQKQYEKGELTHWEGHMNFEGHIIRLIVWND